MDKQILVIGSSGYLGQRVAQLVGGQATLTHRTTAKFPNSLPFDFYNDAQLPLDIVDAEQDQLTVIFTAAVEMNQPPDKLEAGMKQLLGQVRASRFVYISSDAIFDGEKGNYSEDDPPSPANPYGHNLVLCEALVTELVPNSCIVRPSYIYGFNNGQLDARLARTRDTLSKGESYTAYDDYYKCPLSVHEVAEAVVYLAEAGYRGPIHVAGARMSSYEFHRSAMEALGIDIARIYAEPMPETPGLMRDTSLNSSRWWRIRQSQPLTIAEALQIDR